VIRWFGGENGYSDAEIRSMVRRIEAMRTKEEAAKPAKKPVKAKRKLNKAA